METPYYPDELELLTGGGFAYDLGGKTYTIPTPTLGTLLRIARIGQTLPTISIDETTPEGELIAEAWQVIAQSAEAMARIVAVATLTGREASEQALSAHAEACLQHLTAPVLYQLVQRIYIASNLADFINATRLIATQSPKPTERVAHEA